MALSEQELKFIDENSDLIEQGEAEIEKIADAFYSSGLYGSSRGKLGILMAYTIYGPKAFKLDGYVRGCDIQLLDVISNLTGLKAKGVPLLPSLFSAKTKVILCKIEKGVLVKKENYRLEDRASLNKKMSEMGANLVTLDSEPARTTLEKAFGKIRKFILSLSLTGVKLPQKYPVFSSEVSGDYENEAKAKEELKFALVNKVTGQFTSDTAKVINMVLDSLMNSLTFKE